MGINWYSLEKVAMNRTILHSVAFGAVMAELNSLECTTLADQEKLVRMIEPALAAVATNWDHCPSFVICHSIDIMTDLLVGRFAHF